MQTHTQEAEIKPTMQQQQNYQRLWMRKQTECERERERERQGKARKRGGEREGNNMTGIFIIPVTFSCCSSVRG